MLLGICTEFTYYDLSALMKLLEELFDLIAGKGLDGDGFFAQCQSLMMINLVILQSFSNLIRFSELVPR